MRWGRRLFSKVGSFGAEPRKADVHEAVESEHTHDANAQAVAYVLAGLLTAAETDVGSAMVLS